MKKIEIKFCGFDSRLRFVMSTLPTIFTVLFYLTFLSTLLSIIEEKTISRFMGGGLPD